MEPRAQLERWREQVEAASEDAVADMDVAKRLLKHGIEALDKIAALERAAGEVVAASDAWPSGGLAQAIRRMRSILK